MNKNLLIYIHGKGGNAAEADHYKPLFKNYDVTGFDYKSEVPWDFQKEFLAWAESVFPEYENVTLVANSIGAYFAMNALSDKNSQSLSKKISEAFFISPVVDMEKLIQDMMRWANVTEAQLAEKKTIATSFGENLSWEYLSYVRQNPLSWHFPTKILYGEHDNLTSFETIKKFAQTHNANLTIMENGEHWFHTPTQIAFLDNWIKAK